MAANIFLVLSLTAVVISAISSDACNLPPHLWCSSMETAQRCNVVAQCNSLTSTPNQLAAAPPVNVALYYESLCPGCRIFIGNQLYPTWIQFNQSGAASVLNVTLNPYGNAHETFDSTTGLWRFSCQHGENECKGNLLETCAMYVLKTIDVYFPFISCMEAGHPPDSAEPCAKQLNLTTQFAQIQKCTQSKLGNTLEHDMAMRTPRDHQYVPWITLNGVHTEEIQREAETDLMKLVCQTYTGTKPPICPQSLPSPVKRHRCHL